MKLTDIKAGYLLVMRDGDRVYNATVIPNTKGVLGCCCPGKDWFSLNVFDDNLIRRDLTGGTHRVMEVWGRAANYALLSNTTESRSPLWKRNERPKDSFSDEEYHKLLLYLYDMFCPPGSPEREAVKNL